jgi:hypothetical protein
LGKIVPLEEERFAGQFGERVGETVSIVEACGMSAFTVPSPSPTSLIRVLMIDRDDAHARSREPEIEFSTPGFTKAGFEDHGSFVKSCCRYETDWVVDDPPLEACGLRFVLRDCDDCRGVDYHQSGSPSSS